MYEYEVVHLRTTSNLSLREELNDWAQKGWRVISVEPVERTERTHQFHSVTTSSVTEWQIVLERPQNTGRD